VVTSRVVEVDVDYVVRVAGMRAQRGEGHPEGRGYGGRPAPAGALPPSERGEASGQPPISSGVAGPPAGHLSGTGPSTTVPAVWIAAIGATA
jgi:hypothetical protein